MDLPGNFSEECANGRAVGAVGPDWGGAAPEVALCGCTCRSTQPCIEERVGDRRVVGCRAARRLGAAAAQLALHT